MNTHRPARRHLGLPALVPAGLALTAITMSPPPAAAAPSGGNEQVALHNESDGQATFESRLNGTAQVTSHDGRFVVFSTAAPLVTSDVNEIDDVYLRDTTDDITILVSAKHGRPGNNYSFEPTMSADGRYIAWTTRATNLTPDTNGSALDVVVKDMYTDKIQAVSVGSDQKQVKKNSFSPVISGNGRHVAFQSFGHLSPKDLDRKEDVYVRDIRNGATTHVSLLPGAGKDVRESVLVGDISDNGNLITFGNDNMLWVRDMSTHATTRFHNEPDAPPCQPHAAGSAGRPAISGNGKFVAFASCAVDLPGDDHASTDVYRLTLATGVITRVTAGANHSYLPSLSRTGRYVGFGSEADNLVTGDTGLPDAFVADLEAGTTTRASQTADGTAGNSWSATSFVAISGDGHSLAYVTYSDNLIADDELDLPEALLWRD